MPATMTAIAKEAGVSVALVSRLLKGDQKLRVSSKTREKVLAVKNRMGGVKKRRGRGLARLNSLDTSRNIVFPLNKVFTPGWFRMNISDTLFMEGFEEQLSSNGFRMSVNFFNPDKKAQFFQEIINSPGYCDGLILSFGIMDEMVAQLLLDHDFPHISNDPNAEPFQVNTVCPHSLNGFLQAIDHLRALGHMKIGFAGTSGIKHYQIISAFAQHGLPLDGKYNCMIACLSPKDDEDQWRDLARETFRNWLDSKPETTALICGNIFIALGLLDVMKEKGLSPKKHLSIIAYDDGEAKNKLQEEKKYLTRIDIPHRQIGERCAELLMNQILHQQRRIVHELLPVQLTDLDNSVGPAPGKSK